MTRDEIIRMAREAFACNFCALPVSESRIERFFNMAQAAERERFYGEDKPDSCVKGCPVGQVCDYCQIIKPVQEQIAKAVSAEREACAKVCDEFAARDKLSNYYAVAANAIRARGQA